MLGWHLPAARLRRRDACDHPQPILTWSLVGKQASDAPTCLLVPAVLHQLVISCHVSAQAAFQEHAVRVRLTRVASLFRPYMPSMVVYPL